MLLMSLSSSSSSSTSLVSNLFKTVTVKHAIIHVFDSHRRFQWRNPSDLWHQLLDTARENLHEMHQNWDHRQCWKQSTQDMLSCSLDIWQVILCYCSISQIMFINHQSVLTIPCNNFTFQFNNVADKLQIRCCTLVTCTIFWRICGLRGVPLK